MHTYGEFITSKLTQAANGMTNLTITYNTAYIHMTHGLIMHALIWMGKVSKSILSIKILAIKHFRQLFKMTNAKCQPSVTGDVLH